VQLIDARRAVAGLAAAAPVPHETPETAVPQK
jgi:hypothetical protein